MGNNECQSYTRDMYNELAHAQTAKSIKYGQKSLKTNFNRSILRTLVRVGGIRWVEWGTWGSG